MGSLFLNTRIEKAREALAAYGDDEAAMRDLLADLMHLSYADDVDYAEEHRIAADHFEYEHGVSNHD